MLKILRRKPKEPMTPGQRYKDDLVNLFGCGMMATLGVCLAAVAVQSAIEEGLPTVADRVFLVLVVIGCIVLTYVGLRAARVIRKGLMEHAPVDQELEAETPSAPLLNTGEVRYSEILDAMPPVPVKPASPTVASLDDSVLRCVRRQQRHLLWKIGVLAALSACSGFCLIMAGLWTPTMVSALVAGEEVPQLLWVIYVFLWGGGWVFAFTSYLQARNFVRHVLTGYVPINSMDREQQSPHQIDYHDINVMDREP